jgi:hypothetical protein
VLVPERLMDAMVGVRERGFINSRHQRYIHRV